MALVNVTIDDKQIAVQSGMTILNAAKEAGIDIPTLCDHPALEPIGACRMCLVEVEKQRALQPACSFRVSEGMVVHTESEKVVKPQYTYDYPMPSLVVDIVVTAAGGSRLLLVKRAHSPWIHHHALPGGFVE